MISHIRSIIRNPYQINYDQSSEIHIRSVIRNPYQINYDQSTENNIQSIMINQQKTKLPRKSDQFHVTLAQLTENASIINLDQINKINKIKNKDYKFNSSEKDNRLTILINVINVVHSSKNVVKISC